MNNNDQLYNNLIPENEVRDFREVMACISASGETSMLRNDIILAFHEWCVANKKDGVFCKKSATSVFIHRIQELFLRENHMVIMLRQAPARYAFYQLRRDGNNMTEITVARFLELKEQYLRHHTSPTPLTIDFAPFSEYMPSMREVKNVGNGIRYLNRFMCSNIFNRPEEWHRKLFEFIKIHNWKGTQLLINGGIINDYSDFPARLEKNV